MNFGWVMVGVCYVDYEDWCLVVFVFVNVVWCFINILVDLREEYFMVNFDFKYFLEVVEKGYSLEVV